MRVIGITGPTGAGKTTALNALSALGGQIIDCDAVYHDLLEHCAPMRQELRTRFGGGVFAPDGRLDRKALGAVVFGDAQALADLNRITHKYVDERVGELLARAEQAGVPAAGVDAIALIESGIARRCDCTVAVTAPDAVRVRRIMAREGISEDYARARVRAQKEEGWFRAHCTYVLVNDCAGPEEFQIRAQALFETILQKN